MQISIGDRLNLESIKGYIREARQEYRGIDYKNGRVYIFTSERKGVARRSSIQLIKQPDKTLLGILKYKYNGAFKVVESDNIEYLSHRQKAFLFGEKDLSLYFREMNTDDEKAENEFEQFSNYYKTAIVLGFSEKQAKYAACKALNFDRPTTAELTRTKYGSLGAVKRDITDKLNLNRYTKEVRDEKIAEIIKTASNAENREIISKVFKGRIWEKLELLEELREDKKLADILRDKPENLAIFEAVEHDPELLEEITKLIESRQHTNNLDSEGRD